MRLLRDNVVIYTGKLASLKRFKDDVSEVKQGFECGIGIANFNDLKEGDIIEFFTVEKVKETLDVEVSRGACFGVGVRRPVQRHARRRSSPRRSRGFGLS